MRHILPPDTINDKQMLSRIIKTKREPRRSLLNTVRPKVELAYNHYAKIAPALANLSPIPLSEEEESGSYTCV